MEIPSSPGKVAPKPTAASLQRPGLRQAALKFSGRNFPHRSANPNPGAKTAIKTPRSEPVGAGGAGGGSKGAGGPVPGRPLARGAARAREVAAAVLLDKEKPRGTSDHPPRYFREELFPTVPLRPVPRRGKAGAHVVPCGGWTLGRGRLLSSRA